MKYIATRNICITLSLHTGCIRSLLKYEFHNGTLDYIYDNSFMFEMKKKMHVDDLQRPSSLRNLFLLNSNSILLHCNFLLAMEKLQLVACFYFEILIAMFKTTVAMKL